MDKISKLLFDLIAKLIVICTDPCPTKPMHLH